MIVVKIHAGLGNQLFQYAFAYALARKHGVDLFIDASYPLYYPTSKEIPDQHYYLNRFSIDFSPLFDITLLKYGHRLFPKKVIKKIYILNLRNRISSLNLKLINENLTQGQSEYADLPDNCYLSGYFQYPELFDPVKHDLRNKLTFSKPSVTSWEEEMIHKAINPIAINLRRKDYLNATNLKNQGICSVEYYRKAIEYINQYVPDATFFVVSDDIPDSRNYLSTIKAKLHFINSDSNKDILSDMYLMQQCKHIILANSSYSWWSAYLSEGISKIVIAPEKWVVNIEWSDYNETIIPNTWVRL